MTDLATTLAHIAATPTTSAQLPALLEHAADLGATCVLCGGPVRACWGLVWGECAEGTRP